MSRAFAVGEWAWCRSHAAPGRIVDVHRLWSEALYDVWLPSLGSVARLDASALQPIDSAEPPTAAQIGATAAASRVAAAESQGAAAHEELVRDHRTRLDQERERADFGFAARRRVTERLGLPEVRAHRHAQLDREERAWRDRQARAARVTPGLAALMLLRVEGVDVG